MNETTETAVCGMNVAVFSSCSLLPLNLVRSCMDCCWPHVGSCRLQATRLFLLSAEAGISVAYVQPSGLRDSIW